MFVSSSTLVIKLDLLAALLEDSSLWSLLIEPQRVHPFLEVRLIVPPLSAASSSDSGGMFTVVCLTEDGFGKN